MANGGRIDYTVGFKVDESGITKIKHELEQLSKMSATSIQKANPNLSMNEARGALIKIRQAVTEVQGAMNKAFDTKTGVMNLQKLHTSLQSLNLKQVQQAFAQAGATGQSAFLGISKAALTTNVQLKNTQTIADKLGTTLINTLKWNISSSMINKFTGAFQEAYGYVQHLDTSLNDIRIVTGKSADEMTRFGEQANKAAKDLGKATTDYTEAALIYYQQGLEDEEVKARAETTLKASNVTGQSAAEVSEQLTAVWNGYKVSAEETELAVDKLAAVAATTAADLEELSKGMSKVASAANSMGVDMDQLNATLATIESVTRQAPESVGTAMKTIYARMGDLKVGKTDEDGVALGEVSGTLQKVGIDILDVNGDLRDMGTVMEEIGNRWDTWSKAEQQAIAIAVAGKRQYNNLFALFDNWDMYIDALETSRESQGTLQRQQDIYMESTAAHIQQLKTEWEDLYDSILDTNTINTALDVFTKILDVITSIVDATGGLKGILSGIVGIVGMNLGKQLANAFAPIIENSQTISNNQAILNQLKSNIEYQKETQAISGQAADAMTRAQDETSKYWHIMNEEEINASQKIIQEIGEWTDKKQAIQEATNKLKEYFDAAGTQEAKGIVAKLGTDPSAYDPSSTAVQTLNKELTETQEKFLSIDKDINKIVKDLEKISPKTKNIKDKIAPIETTLDGIDAKLHSAQAGKILDPTELQKAETALKTIRERLNEIKTKKVKIIIDEKTKNAFKTLSASTGIAEAELEKMFDSLNNGATAFNNCNANLDGLSVRLKRLASDTKLTIQQVSQLLGAFSALYYAFNSLSNIGSIIKNDDLDRAEKFKQIIGSLVMGLPMLVTAISKIGVIKDVFAKMSLFISRFKSELSEYLIQMGKVGAATKVLKSLSEQEQKTLLVEAGVRNMNVKSLTAEEKIMVFNTAAKKGNKIANDALSKSNIKLRGTLEALKTVSPFGWISTAITAITLITTAVVKFRNEAQKATAQHRSDYAEKILEESKKASEVLHQEYENTKTLVEEYKRLREEYTDPEDIDELRRRIYELSQQYGIHIDTLQLMTSNYEELDEMMNQLLADISGKQAAADLELINREIDALVAKMKSIQADNNHPFLNLFLQCQNITEIILEKVEEIIEKITGVEIPDWMRDFVPKPINVGFGVSAANKNLLADSSETVQGVISVSNSGQLELDEEKFAKYSKEQKEEVKEWVEENYSENDSIWSGIMKIFDHSAENIEKAINETTDKQQEIEQSIETARKDAAEDAFTQLYGDKDIGKSYEYESAKKAIAEKLVNDLEITEKEAYELAEETLEKNASYDIATANALLQALYKPSSDEEEAIKKELMEYQKGGNVDLLNRGIRYNDDGSYSTVETQGFGDDKVGYFNFTPIIVDEDGNYVRTLSDDALVDYVNGIIYEGQPDIYNLQIGAKFDTVEEADAAAERIHELQSDLYGYEAYSKQILEYLDEIPAAGMEAIASHTATFEAMLHQGYSVEEIFENLSSSVDILTHQDHVVKISTVLEGDIKKEKDIEALFSDPTFDLGIDKDNFELLNKSDQYALLLNESRKEIDAINELSDAEKTRIKERGEALTQEIKDLSAAIREEFSEEKRQALEDETQLVKEELFNQTAFGNDKTESWANKLGMDKEEFQEEMSETFSILADFYQKAEEEGKDFDKELEKHLDELIPDEKIANLIKNKKFGKSLDFKNLIKQWGEADDKLSDFDEELEEQREQLDGLYKEYEDMLDVNINYAKRITQVKQAMSALNKDIDSIQSAYQSLQAVVKDYNDDQMLNLDNLQTLLELDDSYVASLQIENGQMSLNEETSRALIDAKLEQAKLDAAELYMDELKVIAEGNVVTATGAAIAANKAEAESLGTLVDAAYEGVDALMQLAEAKAAAAKDPEQTREATQAFYNRIQLIDSMKNQPTSQLLGKADKSSKSSSSSSKKEAEHVDNLERETDLYRKINMELDDIEKTLGRIQNIESHEWGIDYQKSLEEENDLLDKQLDKLKQKKAIQEQDLSIRRKQLEDIGVSFNAEGSVMNNAEETLNSLYANYNAMAAKYNAMSVEQQKGFKTTLETEKDRIEKIEKKMSEYESTFSDYQSTLDSLLEAHYAEIENEVKKFNNMVEVHLELSEAEREWNDFWYDVVQDVDDDDFAKQIEKSFSKLDSLILGTDNDVSVLTGHLNDTVTEVEALIASANRGGEDSLFGDDTAAAKENLEDYRDKLMKALTEAKEEVDNISENYIKMLEHAQDLIDDQVDGWESIGDHLEHNMELIKLISGDKAFDALDKQYEKQYQNNLNLINAQKQSQDFWAGEIERYKQLLEVTDKNTVQWKTYSEALEKASENYKKAVEDLDKTVEEALKNLEDWRKNQSDAIMDAIDKAMSGGLGLDLVEQEWKMINDQADKYLDNVQRAYSMEEYANELDKAANATGLSATNQAKLNAFREQELAQLREKDKLTKYDIEESRARLAILQQQLALEDAQRNKSNMRLRRDSQGNYTYQYTADENAVDEAEGGLLTAKKEWYELVKARRKETNDWIIEAEKNLASILAQIDEAEKAGDIERLNKYKDMELLARQEVQDAYKEAGVNIQDIYDGVALYFANVNNAAILPENAAVVSQLVKDWAGEGEQNFLGAVKKALDEITKLQELFGEKTKKILNTAGINYTKLKEQGIDPVDESLEDLQMDNEDLAIALEDVNDELTTQEGNLRQVEAAYYALQSAAVSAIQSANAALVALAQTAVQTQMQVAAAVTAARNAAAITGSYYNKGGNTGAGTGKTAGKTKAGTTADDVNLNRLKHNAELTAERILKGSVTAGTSKGGQTPMIGTSKGGQTPMIGTSKGGQTPTISGGHGGGHSFDTNNGISYIDGQIAGLVGGTAGGVSIGLYEFYKDLLGFATGGYTGAWPGSDGKLAVLHQKELVLNESDTKNILGAVEAIRALDFNGVAKSLVQSANIQAQVLASVGESVLQALNVNQGDSVSNYRNVTVNADFSGVRSADAIYQALMELENTGMQTSFAN